ncbi:hypothetical protein Acr_22g0003920 [Actinidia rufa]|uniref:Uncharacterized protein n=1 Tax=Actinidia rufa TaxID=165716 RepID=A0A7J0GJV0_9ERIC|nr:hypothetical protein Acr_22g0003920 [Actinidia rufa]
MSTALLGAVVAEAVLDVIEPGGGVGSEANAAVSQPLGCADLAVAVFLAGGPDNVAALHLHDLAAGVPQAQSQRCLTVVVGLFRFSLYMFDGFGSLLLLHVLEKDLGSGFGFGFGFGEAEDAVEDGVDVDDEDGGGDSFEDPDSDPCFDFASATVCHLIRRRGTASSFECIRHQFCAVAPSAFRGAVDLVAHLVTGSKTFIRSRFINLLLIQNPGVSLSYQMTSPITFPVDDKDLDDATLWAVIDSAAASLSSASKTPKPLALRNHHSPENDYRPQKMTRSSVSELSETSPLVMVQRTPTAPPPSYPSPESRRFSVESSNLSYGQIEEKENMRHSLSGRFPSVSLFKEYQNAAMAILEKSDYTMISGSPFWSPFIKKSGWRKISFYFNLSFEIKDKTIEFDENRNVLRAEFVVRAHMQGGRFSDGWGSCERREKRFSKPNHDIPSTAETRAKNKACQITETTLLVYYVENG